jgi:hypothetical protein
MRSRMTYAVAIGLWCGVVIACERRTASPVVGDASTTSAATPAGEQAIERTPAAGPPAAAPAPAERVGDAGGAATPPSTANAPSAASAPGAAGTSPDGGRPSWVPRDATLTVVRSVDRDRNLGVVAAEPSVVTIDAGNCDVGIEVRRKP